MAKLQIPAHFGAQAALDWFREWAAAGSAPDLELVFPSDLFVQPCGVVLLAAAVSERQRRGLKTLARLDQESDGIRYLQRVDFFSSLGLTLPEAFRRHDPAGRFVPLQCVSDHDTAHRLAEETVQFLQRQTSPASASLLRLARFVLEELAVNVVEHSGAPLTGFMAAQVYPGRQAFQIAIADHGVGFKASLERNHELQGRIADDAAALRLAVEQGLSSKATAANAGIGLMQLRLLAERFGAELRIASGDALWCSAPLQGRRIAVTRMLPARWPGAWICLEGDLPERTVSPMR